MAIGPFAASPQNQLVLYTSSPFLAQITGHQIPSRLFFVDSIHALGISSHSIGRSKPTVIQDPKPGTQLTVKFKSGHATGGVTKATSKWANVSFHDSIYSVDSQTSYTMHMPCHAFMDYSRPSHSKLVPERLRPQATIPEPPTPPHNARALGVSRHRHPFALQLQHYLEEKSLIKWGCHDASQALTAGTWIATSVALC